MFGSFTSLWNSGPPLRHLPAIQHTDKTAVKFMGQVMDNLIIIEIRLNGFRTGFVTRQRHDQSIIHPSMDYKLF